MSDLFLIEYPGKPCYLPFLNWVGNNLELRDFILCNVCVHLVGSVPVGVEPVHMVCGGVIALPELQRGDVPNWWLSYGFFFNTDAHGRGILVDIIWVNQSGKWRMFLILPVRIISIMKSSSWGHESHWRLLPWVFTSRLHIRQIIFL